MFRTPRSRARSGRITNNSLPTTRPAARATRSRPARDASTAMAAANCAKVHDPDGREDRHRTDMAAARAKRWLAHLDRRQHDAQQTGGHSEQPRLRSALVVLVVAAPPDARLVASFGGAVEPLVHAPEAVQSAGIGGIGVVDDAVLAHERAEARQFALVGGRVGSGRRREIGDKSLA